MRARSTRKQQWSSSRAVARARTSPACGFSRTAAPPIRTDRITCDEAGSDATVSNPGPPRREVARARWGAKRGRRVMAKCEVCGNDYYLSFQVIAAGATHVFDSFECAIHKLAPICDHCGCKIVGHGIEANGTFYCC